MDLKVDILSETEFIAYYGLRWYGALILPITLLP